MPRTGVHYCMISMGRQHGLLDLSGLCQLPMLYMHSWPASRETNSMASAAWYHHVLKASVSPEQVTGQR